MNSSEINDLFYDSPLLMHDYKDKKFEFLSLNHIGSDKMLVALDNSKKRIRVMGILQLSKYPAKDDLYMMKMVSVHPDYRQRGVAKALIKEMCSYMVATFGTEKRLELSAYEKSGEVLINTVTQIAKEFPELSIKHRVWGEGGIAQEAKNNFLRLNDEVVIDDPVSGYKGIGTIFYFDELNKDMVCLRKNKVNSDDEEKAIFVNIKYLSLNK